MYFKFFEKFSANSRPISFKLSGITEPPYHVSNHEKKPTTRRETSQFGFDANRQTFALRLGMVSAFSATISAAGGIEPNSFQKQESDPSDRLKESMCGGFLSSSKEKFDFVFF